MTNEKVIKLELCPVEDISANYKPPEENSSEKGDIYSFGCIFYQICFLVNDLQKGKFEQFEQADTEYSKRFNRYNKIYGRRRPK